jgi:hypothetical protein
LGRSSSSSLGGRAVPKPSHRLQKFHSLWKQKLLWSVPLLETKLLSLRKEYKKTTVALAKARAHLEFISSCKEKQQTPRGLQVNIHCSAFMFDLTSVREQFGQTTKLTEQSYVDHLKSHYDVVVDRLSEKEDLLTNTMATLQTQATPQDLTAH